MMEEMEGADAWMYDMSLPFVGETRRERESRPSTPTPPSSYKAHAFFVTAQKALLTRERAAVQELIWGLLVYGMLEDAADLIDSWLVRMAREEDEAFNRGDLHTLDLIAKERKGELWPLLRNNGITRLYDPLPRIVLATDPRASTDAPRVQPDTVCRLLQEAHAVIVPRSPFSPPTRYDYEAAASVDLASLLDAKATETRKKVDPSFDGHLSLSAYHSFPFFCAVLEFLGSSLPAPLYGMIDAARLSGRSGADTLNPRFPPLLRRVWELRDLFRESFYPSLSAIAGKRTEAARDAETPMCLDVQTSGTEFTRDMMDGEIGPPTERDTQYHWTVPPGIPYTADDFKGWEVEEWDSAVAGAGPWMGEYPGDAAGSAERMMEDALEV